MRCIADGRYRRQQGFTVIELMTVIAIALILTMIAVPSFMDSMRRNAVTGRVNELLGALQIARSEAVTRNGTVTFCIMDADDEEVCDAGGSLADGWLVFSDVDGDAVMEPGLGGDVILASSSDDESDQFTFDPSAPAITFGAMGTPSVAFTIDVCRSDEFAGKVQVELTGRASASKLNACP